MAVRFTVVQIKEKAWVFLSSFIFDKAGDEIVDFAQWDRV